MSSREERIDDLATEDVDTLITIIIDAEEERDRLLSERQELINAIEDMLDGRFSRVTGYADTRQATGEITGWISVAEELPTAST